VAGNRSLLQRPPANCCTALSRSIIEGVGGRKHIHHIAFRYQMSDSTPEKSFHERLVAGTDSAASELDHRYRERLCALVAREMDRRFIRREDPEDVVQSALRSFFRGIDEGRFRVDHSGALWALLETIAIHKLLKHKEKEAASKRTPIKEEYPDVRQLLGREPTPADAAVVADLIEKIIEGLDSPYPEILRMRLEGWKEKQIADELACGRQAVHYKLGRLRERLNRLVGDESDRRD
jgi:RNA polymerase sigma factor (sigma-70 family)